jgi:hypothetical protein
LTEYGLAPINCDPRVNVAATPGAVGRSRWQAPEIAIPARKGSSTPIMESKAADVFAFGTLVVEVYTGKIPLRGQRDKEVVIRISQGGRPGMPVDVQTVGITTEMWMLLENCWYQNPNMRPSMGVVVSIWQRFVENGDSNGVVGCVQVIPVNLTILNLMI